jgi:hypothetical protein
MDSKRELQLFGRLARNEPDFENWLSHELQQVSAVLVSATEDHRLRMSQGQAQFIIKALKLLEVGKSKG